VLYKVAMSEEIENDLLKKVGRRIGDVSDLPEALRNQLNTARMDDLEEKIIKTIRNRFDGVASIDEIMVGLYRDFEYITEDRRFIANKVYRMTKAGHLQSVPKRKGIVMVKR
jgi:hypothetical protein